MSQKTITAFVTKYALTTGVYKVRGEVSEDGFSIHVKEARNTMRPYWGTEWQRTEEAAIARVKDMIAAKKKAADRALAKWDALLVKVTAGKLPMDKDKPL